MTKFRLRCQYTDIRHTKFAVYDPHGVNCGFLTLQTDDLIEFISRSWNGEVHWDGHFPYSLEGMLDENQRLHR